MWWSIGKSKQYTILWLNFRVFFFLVGWIPSELSFSLLFTFSDLREKGYRELKLSNFHSPRSDKGLVKGLENPMDKGPWQATVHRVVQSQTRLKQLHKHACAKGLGR